MFFSDGEMSEYETFDLNYITPNGLVIPYPFKCGDFEADDWRVILVDTYGECGSWVMRADFKDSVRDWLASSYSHLLLDLFDAERLLKSLDGDKVERIFVKSILKEHKIELLTPAIKSLSTIGYGVDDLFEIEVLYRDGTTKNLAEEV